MGEGRGVGDAGEWSKEMLIRLSILVVMARSGQGVQTDLDGGEGNGRGVGSGGRRWVVKSNADSPINIGADGGVGSEEQTDLDGGEREWARGGELEDAGGWLIVITITH